MDKKEIKSVWAAFLEVQEAKKKLDPVGQEDGDIDNDGDEDSSDEYLKNRRKKIGKEIKKEGSEESPYPSLDKKKREKKGSNLEPAGGPADKLKGESVEEKVECPKCEGKGCDHCDDKGYHMVQKENPAIVALSQKKMKKESLFSEEELAGLEEKMKQPNDNASAGEPFMSTNSEGEKKFAGDHKKSDKKFEDMEDASEEDAAKAGRGVKSQSPTRRGEKRVGDTAMEKPTKAAGQ